jgi:hypothetical protein
MPKIRSFLTFAYGTLNSLFMWSLVVKFLWNTDKYIIIIYVNILLIITVSVFCSTLQIKKIPFQGVSIPMDHIRGWFTRRSHHVKIDITFLLVKSEVQSRLVILKSCLMSPVYFCHVSYMKMSISCLLKSIVFIKYFESDFLEK